MWKSKIFTPHYTFYSFSYTWFYDAVSNITNYMCIYAQIYTRASTSSFKILQSQIRYVVYPYFCVWLYYCTRALLLCILKYFWLLYICGGFIVIHLIIHATPVVSNLWPTNFLCILATFFNFIYTLRTL